MLFLKIFLTAFFILLLVSKLGGSHVSWFAVALPLIMVGCMIGIPRAWSHLKANKLKNKIKK